MDKQELVDLCVKHGVEHDINKRWETGMDHHPQSEKLMEALVDVDWNLANCTFDWKTGGDGDNGEDLMYQMDIVFELRDKGVNI